jgi:hypothetical protein
MAREGHLYRNSIRGRSITSAPGVGGISHAAHLACSRCPTVGERKLRQILPPDQIDQKFAQAGWTIDPHVCPDCRARRAKEKTMASKPSPAALQAQVQMITLLQEQFDTDKGAYATGWSDQKIAADTKLAVEHVVEVRRAAFGEIKEPSEIRQLRSDINALEQLHREASAQMSQDLATLRSKLASVSARWAA